MSTLVDRTWLRRALTYLTLLIVPLTLLGVYAAIQAEFRDVRELRATTQRTVQTEELLADLLALHADAETAVRGYVITQNEAFLEPYEAAVERREALFAAISEFADPTVRARLPRLRQLSEAKLSTASANVAAVRAGNVGEARDRIASGRGKRVMDQIRVEIGLLRANEDARLAELVAASAASRDLLERSIVLMLVGLAALLLVVTIVVSRTMQARSDALQRSNQLNERLNAIFDGSVDGMLLLDGEGRILRMNPSISRMFGYAVDQLVGRHTLILMKDDYSPEESQALLATVGAAGTHGAGWRQEFTGRRADGSTFETEVAISRVSGADGRRYVAAIRDISDRKRAEQMKTEFVSTVSHELRTPLTSIGGSLGLLGAGAVGPLNDKARRLVEIAHANCERLVRLINDILDIEKIESGKMEFDLRRMQVAPLVNRTIDAMRGFADQHDVTLRCVLPPWPQCIIGDPDKLEQLLTNLISNAIKHAPPGSQVEVFALHEGGSVRIEVRDRGSGVPENFRGRIFGKFAMADASDNRAKGGTGLGLAIAREIARRHGGEVGYDDREGGGTVFHVHIPMLTDDADAERQAISVDLPRLMHLDDDEDTLAVVASAFNGKAFVLSAHTVAEAREILTRTAIAGAILDVGLAYESGLDIIPDLRAQAGGLPIVVFTALDEAREAGEVDRILIKSRSRVADLVNDTMALLDKRREAA